MMRDIERPKNEIPVNFATPGWQRLVDGSHPITPLQALMEAAPGDEPRETIWEKQEKREAVADCLELLSEESRWVLNAIEAERLSFRQLAPLMGLSKSQVHRIYKRALRELKEHLVQHPVIIERLQ